ncbi:MAG TPA: sulfite dehydrogenase [Candidatus Elarobacter sp.]
MTAVAGATSAAAAPAGAADASLAPYGSPSRFEADVVRRPRGVPTPAMTPLGEQLGIITPSGLAFVRNHAGTPSLDPRTHRLVVHGLVKKPLSFSIADLMRFPSVERIHFLECSGNSANGWSALGAGVQFSHGLLSCALWTGVPLRAVLDEAGLQPDAAWVVAEGADGALYDRSIPLGTTLDDALLVYGQNGEMLRPENGYPLRLLVPGFEGSANVKWLRRLKVTAAPVYSREETAQYTQPGPDGKIRLFDLVMEAKSVITYPSPGRRLDGPGFYELRGFAWSGRGRITRVDVSTDGGTTWSPAQLDDLRAPKALTRFTAPLRWNGAPVELQSRAADDAGGVQPTRAALVAARGSALRYHVNAIARWAIDRDGRVTNLDA